MCSIAVHTVVRLQTTAAGVGRTAWRAGVPAEASAWQARHVTLRYVTSVTHLSVRCVQSQLSVFLSNVILCCLYVVRSIACW